MEKEKKKVLVILAEGFEETEALVPIDLLRRAGSHVCISSLSDKVVTGSHGIRIESDTKLSEVLDDSFHALVLPGGMNGAENLSKSEEVKKIIFNMNNENKFICAICASPAVVLAPLGILDGKRAVCYPGMEVKDRDITFGTDNVCKYDNIITSRGMGTSMEFGLKIVESLYGNAISEELAKKVCYSY